MKRFLASLLALLMLALPLAGSAESVPASLLTGAETGDYYADALAAGRRLNFTMNFSDVATSFTGEPAVDQVIADVFGALVISGYAQGDEEYFAISMKQASGEVADLLTMGVAVAGDDAYILSNLIGGTIVVGADEVVPVLERLLDMLVMVGFIPEDEVAEIKAQLPALWEMVVAEYEAAMSSANAMENLDFASFDYTALTGMLTTLMEKMVVGEPTALPRNCDPAVAMVTMTMTPDEMNGVIISALQFLKDNPELSSVIAAELDFDNTFAPQFSGVAGEPITFDGFLDMLISELAENKLYAGDVTYCIWLGEDNMPVAMNMVAPIADGEETVNINLNYTRLTMNDSVAHSVVIGFPGGDVTANVVVKAESVVVNLAAAENGETIMDMMVDYTWKENENQVVNDMVMEMNVNADGEAVSMKVVASSDIVFNGVDFVEKSAVSFTLNGKEYFTVDISIETAEAGASIMTGDVVRPAELSDADFANWFVNVYMAIFSWAQNAIYALPASVLNLVNTGF